MASRKVLFCCFLKKIIIEIPLFWLFQRHVHTLYLFQFHILVDVPWKKKFFFKQELKI